MKERKNCMSKKIFTTLTVVALVCAMSVSAMAGTLYSIKNEWFFDSDVAGKLVVADNKKDFTFDAVVGTTNLGKQSGFTGQLKLVSEPVAPKHFKVTFVSAAGNFRFTVETTTRFVEHIGCEQEDVWVWDVVNTDQFNQLIADTPAGYEVVDWSWFEILEGEWTNDTQFFGWSGRVTSDMVVQVRTYQVVNPLVAVWDEFTRARNRVYLEFFETMDPCFYSTIWNTGNNDCVEGLMWLYYDYSAEWALENVPVETLYYYIAVLNGYEDWTCTCGTTVTVYFCGFQYQSAYDSGTAVGTFGPAFWMDMDFNDAIDWDAVGTFYATPQQYGYWAEDDFGDWYWESGEEDWALAFAAVDKWAAGMFLEQVKTGEDRPLSDFAVDTETGVIYIVGIIADPAVDEEAEEIETTTPPTGGSGNGNGNDQGEDNNGQGGNGQGNGGGNQNQQ
jgi:hypothetical protein